MKILDFLHKDGIISSLRNGTKEEILSELVEPIVKANPGMNKQGLLMTLLDREKFGSTGIGGGIAIPHGKFDGLEHLEVTFGKNTEGVDFDSLDGKPTYLFFCLLAPKNSGTDHLKALARISRLFKDPVLTERIRTAETAHEIYEILEESDLRVT